MSDTTHDRLLTGEWYEINYAGNQEQMRLDMARVAGARGIMAGRAALVDRCLADYDLGGWTGDTWLDPAPR